jgi:predicted O-methyltransferase YrrM
MLRKAPSARNFLHDVVLGPPCKLSSHILNIKKQMLADKRFVAIEDMGAGSRKMGYTRRISDIARLASSDSKKGKFLYNMVQLYKPGTIIELGTSLGFGTIHMGSAMPETRVISVEGSKVLYDIALKNIEQLGFANINLVNASFDYALPELLRKNAGCDMLFVDGNHTKEATLKYFQMFLPYAKPESIIIFDDIRWSEGMYEAWTEIQKHERVSLSIDLFSVGVVYFMPTGSKEHFRIYY